jgi:hypothetical protein
MSNEQKAGGIFINYRQRDANNNLQDHALFVDALSRRLSKHFGDEMVFVDTTITPGVRYPDELRVKLVACNVLLAVIHPTWLTDLHQRRPRPGTDWVRYEIKAALTADLAPHDQSTPLPKVIPILLEGSKMPAAAELPDDIRHLADLPPFLLRSGSLDDDLSCLLEELERYIPTSWKPAPDSNTKQSRYSSLGLLETLLAGTIIIIVVFQSSKSGLAVMLFTLLTLATFGMALIFLMVAVYCIIGRVSHRVERRIQSQPLAQSMLLAGLALFSIMPSLAATVVDTAREEQTKMAVSEPVPEPIWRVAGW